MIPQTIHQMWIGTPLPAHLAGYVETWKRHHPEWQFRWWDQDTIRPLLNQDLWDRAAEISPGTPEQFRSDVARYEILYQLGGVWVDVDFECLRPIDELCDVEAFLAWEMPGRWLNQAIFGAVPGHPLLADLIACLPDSVRRNRRHANTRKSGPQFVTPHALRRGITTYPKEHFYPYLWNELDRGGEAFPDAYAIHHWNHRRTM